MKPAQEKIVLNIGGVRYKTYLSTLQAFPGTKLCRLTEPQAAASFDCDPSAKEFFFDRNANLFDEVLNYYRTKHLHCPEGVCKSVLEEELAFWGVQEALLAPCCWQKLHKAERQEEESQDWAEEDSRGLSAQTEGSGWRARWQPRIWDLFEKPCSSLRAKGLAAVSLLFNLTICILALLISHVTGHVRYPHDSRGHYNESRKSTPDRHSLDQMFHHLLYLELACVLWFTFEFIVRAAFCPDKKKFLKNPLNMADFFSLFPVYIELFSDAANGGPVYWLGFFRILYFPKLLKMLKLLETPLVFRVLSYTSKSLLREVLILLMVFTLEIIFFGVLVNYAEFLEQAPESFFGNLSSSFWWAAITLTTVGYGDVYPFSASSKVVGVCVALSGVLTIVIPTVLFYIKFKGYYDAAVIKEKVKRMKKN